MEPNAFSARAHAAYPERREAERNVMWLEKEVSNYLGIEPIYTGGDLRKITSVLNRQRISGTASSLPATGTENA